MLAQRRQQLLHLRVVPQLEPDLRGRHHAVAVLVVLLELSRDPSGHVLLGAMCSSHVHLQIGEEVPEFLDLDLATTRIGGAEKLHDGLETDIFDQARPFQARCLQRDDVQGQDMHRIHVGFMLFDGVEAFAGRWICALPH